MFVHCGKGNHYNARAHVDFKSTSADMLVSQTEPECVCFILARSDRIKAFLCTYSILWWPYKLMGHYLVGNSAAWQFELKTNSMHLCFSPARLLFSMNFRLLVQNLFWRRPLSDVIVRFLFANAWKQRATLVHSRLVSSKELCTLFILVALIQNMFLTIMQC